MIAKILECAGYKTGLFTSPHLINVNERIRINGKTINDTEIQNFINNAESPLVNEIQDKIGEIRKQAQMKPLKIAATEEQIKKGVPVNFHVPITFDMSNFFG